MGSPLQTPCPPALDPKALERTLTAARRRLLEARVPAGPWEGRLSSSALSTATAVVALETVRRRGGPDHAGLVRAGLRWLAEHPNADGGFGDTVDSPSNISTTALCWAALAFQGGEAAGRAEAWLRREIGDLAPGRLAEAIGRRYGNDRTFSVPILTMCAIAGRFGEGPDAWKAIPCLPFELAALPASWYRWLGLTVVSYALPALIAIGQALHHHAPTRNPVARLARAAARKRTLRILEAIQPASGGFLEATPLTSFVTMSLAASGQVDHPVTRKAAEFLAASARPDGSWPIDTNLATWVTTLSLQALAAGGALKDLLSADERRAIRTWLLRQQYRDVHPYTRAAPGGWAWTDRSGGVPDADDTPGALLALGLLREGDDADVLQAARAGVAWLLDLQNADGGMPTFCRGWGKLPFDQSCPDLTAHAVRAWSAWRPSLPDLAPRIDAAAERAFAYLVRAQRPDGSWVPLWFGNQHAPDQANPVYGTSRVLLAAPLGGGDAWRQAVDRGRAWLLSAQNPDGGFGGAPSLPPTVEETALALEALSGDAAARAARWLADRTAEGTRFDPSPIGLYFAKLWYWETLYPVLFTVGALGRFRR
jgi:squalene-hopene/tetraprenyl-beta-curcumene cyclase